MRRWGRLIELVIVVLVALLCAFGLIYAYRVICYDLGYCGALTGGGGLSGAYPDLFRQCDEDLRSGGYTIREYESHEFNVRFQRGQTAAAVVRLSPSFGGVPQGQDLDIELWLVTPESELVNSRCPTCRMRLVRRTDGRFEGAVTTTVPDNGREDFRIFVTNNSNFRLRYCLKIDENVGRFEPDLRTSR